MATISLCMIVKNEEKVLKRCLDSVADLMDEIIIVDTGSTDQTIQIAKEYTDHIYQYTWIDDFASARNFSFSKASCDYIYQADADEVLNAENHEKFRALKENLLPEIEVVQMYYGNQLSHGSVYNFDKELRPKLFKRVRNFVFEDPIHEMVRLSPVIYDSEIEITHLPEESHARRDLQIFQKQIQKGTELSERLIMMYARELYIAGEVQDFLNAKDYFIKVANKETISLDTLKYALCVLVKAFRIEKNYIQMYHYALKDIASEGVSEICCELGTYYFDLGNYAEAAIWFYNAAHEARSILNIKYEKEIPLARYAECEKKLINA